ncbi:MAG: protein kinase [Gemmataceae bacterium]|nr:protein kinase [Gemmataceae bacterium]
MGTVWVAEQSEPVKRRVALKVIKPGMDSARVVARFEAERQALALMDHTNIAKVFDGGTTPAGRPYFVMELVKGVPITQYCDELHLSIRDRLGLFVQVCAAVQHAHQKGVIHRDLKPSNVLVAIQDGRPVPKVIDFGVAKAVGARLTDETMYTELGAVIGTLEYMAPEQAELSALDVDTRADVYALGVLLFELLTGTTPLTRSRLKAAGFAEVLRVIREEEPPKPSTRLTEAKDGLAGLAAARRTDPKRLAREVRGELDWIVLRALEKDRTRRYETANGLARDVGRFLADEPVEAGPPSGWYRLRKFARRNRGPLAATAVVLLALVTGLAASLWQADRATRAERLAQSERAAAVDEREKAEAARKEADDQRKVAERQAASTAIDLYAGMGSDDSDEGRRAYLQLARLARTLPPHAADLREYITARLVYDLQGVAPLAGDQLAGCSVSPDGRYVAAAGAEGYGLFETPTNRRLATLREGDESVRWGGFGSDGRFAYTVAADGVVRAWEVPSGRLRLRTGRTGVPGHLVRVALGPGQLAVWANLPAGEPNPVSLWDVAGGRFVGRLDGHTRPSQVVFAPDGRAALTLDETGPVRVWSAADGRLVAELHDDGLILEVAFSPTGRRVMTFARGERVVKTLEGVWPHAGTVRWWDAGAWRPLGPPVRWDDPPPTGLFGVRTVFGEDEAVVRSGNDLCLVRGSAVVARTPFPGTDILIDPAARVATDGRRLIRLDTGRVEFPAPGRRYHPGAAAFARDGRWLIAGGDLIDLAADKSVANGWGASPMPGGFFIDYTDMAYSEYRYIPTANAAVPADLLERWVQVVLGGELGAGDEFVPWDEPTWERHRAELAAVPPLPLFPFPGQVATDRLYWLKRQYKQVENDPAQALPLLDRLVAAEPTRGWYATRAEVNVKLGRWSAAADDYLAAKADVRSIARNWAEKPGEPAEKYRAAVRLAEAARRARPDHWEPASALGMALYRVGRDRDAVQVLTEANALYRLTESARWVVGPVLLSRWAGLAAAPPTHDHPANLAFLAMAHHRLGEADLARARLADLAPARVARAGYGHPLFDETEDLSREVEKTLAAPPAPPPK